MVIDLLPPKIIFEPLFPDVEIPRPATENSAGIDVRAYLWEREVVVVSSDGDALVYRYGDVWIPGGGRVALPLGFKARLPDGWECQVRPRSGLALNKGLTVLNTPGTIDADFPGEWAVILHNTSKQDVVVRHGDRIAQLVLSPVYRLEWTLGKVEETTERVGGFGSTGT